MASCAAVHAGEPQPSFHSFPPNPSQSLAHLPPVVSEMDDPDCRPVVVLKRTPVVEAKSSSIVFPHRRDFSALCYGDSTQRAPENIASNNSNMRTPSTSIMIAFEGCEGAGKSTIAKGLAAFRKSDLIETEATDQIHFSFRFFEDPKKYALETELTFLLVHFHRLKARGTNQKRDLVCDFHLRTDLIYADLNLNGTPEKRIFQDVYDFVSHQVPSPDVTVCLSASDKLLNERIRQRNPTRELRRDPKYYAAINAACEASFERHQGRKVRISTDEWDFVRDPSLYQRLSKAIDEVL